MHTIRLRHPWQAEPADDGVVWSRKFNWPAELDADERVHLIVDGVPATTDVTLNEKVLGDASASPFLVNSELVAHNLLVLHSPDSAMAERFPYEVRLEIVAGQGDE